MGLLDAIWADEQSRLLTRPLYDAVTQGVAPFRPGRITLFSDYDIDYMRYRLVVEVENVPEIFEDQIDPIRCRDAGSYYDDLSKNLLEFYRYRPSLPVDDHIQLGED